MAASDSPQLPWSCDAAALAEQFRSDLEAGLTSEQAATALDQFGPNKLTEEEGPSLLWMFLSQFANFMIGLLAAAAVVSALLDEVADSILIGLIVLANGIIGFYQERRAEKAMAALQQYAQPMAKAYRDGKLVEVPAAEVVPGDVLELEAGNFVPADGRLLEAVELQTDEAPLTGESLPVAKNTEALPEKTSLPDRVNMAYMGTTVSNGHGKLLVTATGMQTELGGIAEMLRGTKAGATPLEQRLHTLSKQLAVIVLAICVVIFVAGVLRAGSQWQDAIPRMFLTAVSLAVAAVPEGLPAVITVALALGSQRMARRHAIIRQLAAVETLGSVKVICSDKTGTLTQNEMQLDEVVLADDAADENWLLRAAVLCNNARWTDGKEADGSATETALLAGAFEHGIDPDSLRQDWPRLREIPFSSSRKRMSTIHESPEGERILFMKGALEQVLNRSTGIYHPEGNSPLSDEERGQLQHAGEELAGQGRRVLGLAMRRLAQGEDIEQSEQVEQDLTYLGYVGIVDPIRKEVYDAIQECRTAGIRPVMVTGDHPGTARAIAEELSMLAPDDEVVTGAELEEISDEELQKRADHVAVFARVAPEHKLRIVKALKANNHVVAMTGDGVNDAPAVKRADIGVSMGITGTDVTQQASKMVLSDDNFATIVAAVEEGRVVYDNIRKFVRYLLTTNTGEILVLLIAILLGWPLPLLPVHLLWINLVTDGLPALALGFEPPERGVMQRQPRPPDESLFAGGMVRDILLMGSFMAVCCSVLYWQVLSAQGFWATSSDASWLYGQTAVFLTLSMFQLFYVLGIRSPRDSFFREPLANTRLLGAVAIGAILQVGVVYLPVAWPAAQDYVNTTPLSGRDLAICLGVASLAFVYTEIRKLMHSAWQAEETADTLDSANGTP